MHIKLRSVILFVDNSLIWCVAQLEYIREVGTPPCDRVMLSLKRLLRTRSSYPEHPVLLSDLRQLTAITTLCVEHWLTSSWLLSNDLVHLWSITDLLFNNSIAFTNVRDFSRHVFLRLLLVSVVNLLMRQNCANVEFIRFYKVVRLHKPC